MNYRWRGTRAELLSELKKLPSVLSGRLPDDHGLGRVFLAVLGNAALAEITAAFRVKSEGGTGSDGVKWAPLKESTLERRRAKGIEHDRRLEETGDLLDSLRPGSDDPDAPRPLHQVFDVEPGAVTVGSSLPYADRHQRGTDHMPARVIVPPDGALPPAWEAAVEAAAERALDAVMDLLSRI
jgi:hypothetical protein